MPDHAGLQANIKSGLPTFMPTADELLIVQR
jgi:hypothetical protein